MAEAVARGLGANVCLLTVRRPGLRDRTYEWTDPAAGFGTSDLVEVPVRHGAEQVGVLAVDRQAAVGLYAQRSHLLTDVADGLGVVLEASRSGIELERQLRAALAHAEEIAVSRRRSVAEMDAERRRIERDLHDGAQHHLVSLRLTLGLVEHQVASGELDQAREWLPNSSGSSPTSRRCSPRPRTGCRRSCWPRRGSWRRCGPSSVPRTRRSGSTTAGSQPARRFPADVEAAVWFCCAEAVGNARKHAQGAPISVGLAERRGALHFTVRDEGPGSWSTPPTGGGRGMRNMTTRLSAVGGHVVVRSAPGEGTAVRAPCRLPAESAAAAAPPAATSARADSGGAGTRPEPVCPTRIPRRTRSSSSSPMTEPVRAVDEPTSLGGQVRELLRWARAAYRDSPAEGRLDELAHRLGEPLRIAVLATVDDGRRMLVEALIGTPDVPRPLDGVAGAGPVRLRRPGRRESGPDAWSSPCPRPALRAMTLIDVPLPIRLGPRSAPADAPVARRPRPAPALRAARGPGAARPCCTPPDTAVRSRCWRWRTRRGPAAEQAVREFGDDPAVRRVCHAVVPGRAGDRGGRGAPRRRRARAGWSSGWRAHREPVRG